MGLKQIKDVDRIIFLKEFVREILINSLTNEILQRKIRAEKIKQKLVEPTISTEEAFKKIIKTSLLNQKNLLLNEENKEKEHREEMMDLQPSKFKIKVEESASPRGKTPSPETRKPIAYRVPIQTDTMKIIPSFMKPRVQQIQSPPEKRPEGFALKRIEQLLNDPAIQSIECPGPGRNVLVRRYGKINITKLNLNQEEITDIINRFSKQAKIPILGGILKAAIGELIISAVISEFVGSRFIINKISPYSMLIE